MKNLSSVRKATDPIFWTTFVVFIVLKLTSLIDWSWGWVTAPIWVGWAVNLSIIGLIKVFRKEKGGEG